MPYISGGRESTIPSDLLRYEGRFKPYCCCCCCCCCVFNLQQAILLEPHTALGIMATPPMLPICFPPPPISLPPSFPPSQSLETIFEILEKKVSLLLSAWKPLWRAHCNAKGLRARLAGGGMGSRLATKRRRAGGGRGGGTSSLGDMVLEMMRSVAGAGVDIEVLITQLSTYLYPAHNFVPGQLWVVCFRVQYCVRPQGYCPAYRCMGRHSWWQNTKGMSYIFLCCCCC